MSEQNQFLKDALSSEYGFVELDGKLIERKYFRNARYCLTCPDIEEGIQWLMESCNRDYKGAL